MTEIKKIFEELNDLIQEDELVDDFDTDVEIEDTTIDVENELSLTDELDAKTKISRCLDNLKAALDTFKTATMSEIDLIKDANISIAIEGLDGAIDSITNALKGKIENQYSLDMMDSEEEEVEESPETELNDEEEVESPAEETEEEESEDEDEDEDSEEVNFDDEAEIDLFS